MPFGFTYWMVFLPEVDPATFLLFVHNPAGATNLRNYVSGRAKLVGQPSVAQVFRSTEIGHTRHECDPHKTDDHGFWYHKTLELNRRYLGATGNAISSRPPSKARNAPVTLPAPGLAARGSQRQLQEYVNLHPDTLTAAILAQLPPRVRELGAQIRWVSPLAHHQYQEYRDADFLARVGLRASTAELAAFWPSGGPCWDALGVISDPSGAMKPGVILVEAKSHIPEIYGNGCQAGEPSAVKIQAALTLAQSWCGISEPASWLGPLYQSANRIAHLYFLLDKLRTPAWLVNIYFTNDPIHPTTQSAWETELATVKAQLGLNRPVRNMMEVFLPALTPTEPAAARAPVPNPVAASSTKDTGARTFHAWYQRWTGLAMYQGSHLPDPRRRIDRLLELWNEPVPGLWQRAIDEQLIGPRYRRGDAGHPHPGEHTIEDDILCDPGAVLCLGWRLIDGINAMPLTRDEAGGRRANVEADLFLLLEKDGAYRLALSEVKDTANNCWYATVEHLRQLRLLHLSDAARQLFHLRNPQLALPPNIPLIGLIVAPAHYYTQTGQKSNAVPHSACLISELLQKAGVEVHLAVWDPARKTIAKPPLH